MRTVLVQVDDGYEHMLMIRCVAIVGLSLLISLLCSCTKPPAMPEPQESNFFESLLDPLIKASPQFIQPGPVQFPADLGVHLHTQFESFTLKAIVYPVDAQGLSPDVVAGLITRMDRVSLRASDDNRMQNSAWSYSGIMHTSTFMDAEVKFAQRGEAGLPVDSRGAHLATMSSLAPRQSVQRLALGLADSDASSMRSGNDFLSIEMMQTGAGRCNRRYLWAADLSPSESIELEFGVSLCPDALSLDSLVAWTEPGIVVTGTLTSRLDGQSGTSSSVKGVAWLSQSWGNVPVVGGAVVLDELQIQLEGGRLLDVSRTKRRSGRGPKTVSAVLREPGQSAKTINLAWQDSTDQQFSADGAAYPRSISLANADYSIGLTISAMNSLWVNDDFSDNRLSVPVTVSGTSEGAGFLSYVALRATQ